MSRRLIVLALACAGGAAHAQPAPEPPPPLPAPSVDPAPPETAPTPGSPAAGTTGPAVAGVLPEPSGTENDIGDQAISVEIGAAAGGRVTPGGLRIAGQFLYQLSDEDWFDGTASFTFGSGTAACFRDRQDAVICSHGVADGAGIEVTASIRRMFVARGAFRPFARVGVGFGLIRFDRDDVSGYTVPAHAGGGVRVAIAPAIAIVAEGEIALGFASLSRGLGSQPQLGLAVTAGAEFRLR
jgi:opacity protein-like surface antigen